MINRTTSNITAFITLVAFVWLTFHQNIHSFITDEISEEIIEAEVREGSETEDNFDVDNIHIHDYVNYNLTNVFIDHYTLSYISSNRYTYSFFYNKLYRFIRVFQL